MMNGGCVVPESRRDEWCLGMARVGVTTKDTKDTNGGVTDDEELIAKR